MKIINRRNFALLTPIFALTLGSASTSEATCVNNLGPSTTPTTEYTLNGDGTVTHTTTGLVWKRCTEGQSGATCDVGAATRMDWMKALQESRDSNFAGYTDWRLPSRKELESIVELTCHTPSINDVVFPNTTSIDTWSSTTLLSTPGSDRAWVVGFTQGYSSFHYKGNDRAVARLVRGGQVFDAFADSAAPETTVTATPASSTATSVSISFAGTDNGAIAGFECSLDGAAYSACTSPHKLVSLSAGAHVFSVRAVDGAGNKDATPAMASWRVIAGMEDSDSDGIPDIVEATEGQVIGSKDNAIFEGMSAKSTRWFAMQQYRDFLSREAETAGLDGWTNILNSGTQNREQVIQSFFNSQEFQNGVPPVVRLYLGYFNRIPDHDGLFGWVNAIRAGTALGTVSGAFAASQEFQNTYGALSDSDFVTLVYRNVLGRAPDTAGFNGWLSQLRGGLTRGNLMIGFTESQEYQTKTRNNVFVIMMYEGMLRRAAEQAGYDGWVSYMNAGSSGLDLTRGFLNSLEYRYRFLPR